MSTVVAKVFNSGNDQAIRLPKQFRLDVDEVFIYQKGNDLVISPRPDSWDGFMQGCEGFSDDFNVEHGLPTDKQRKGFD
jgi:antitoxin VapB